jgi:hypothetical protein
MANGATATSDCRQTTTIPMYASICHCMKGFASACSCLTSGNVPATTATTTTTTKPPHPAAPSLLSQPPAFESSIVKTVCACMEPQPTTTVSASKTCHVPILTFKLHYSFMLQITVYTCPAPTSVTEPFANFGPINYNQIFQGVGAVEIDNNPGNVNANQGYPPFTTYFDGSYTDCRAVKACADATALHPRQQYLSFDLHYLIASKQWECVSSLQPQLCPQYYSQVNADVSVVYGYSVAVVGCY